MNHLKRFLTFSLFAALIVAALSVFRGGVSAQESPDTPDETYKIYLPIATRHLPVVDLTFVGIEITQGTQTDANAVAMIANRPTLVRVYAKTNMASPSTNVSLSVSAQRNGATLPGSPAIVGPITLTQSVSRTSLSTSFNLQLPPGWLAGRVTLLFALDSANTVTEADESNNATGMVVNFTDTSALNIKVVPINYTHPPNGKTYYAASNAYMAPAFMRMYPIAAANITTRVGFNFSQNLDNTSSWENLLDLVTDLYQGDGSPPNMVYYTPIPLEDNNGNTWFYSGTAGLGWVNYPVSIGLTNSNRWGIDGGWIVTHEVGHNMNRRHAPCGVSGATDPNYPYAGGKIGQIGVDVSALALKLPNVFNDIMGYCDNQWVSDYTYNGILAKRNADALIAAGLTTRPTLMLRLRPAGENPNTFESAPAYVIDGYPSPQDDSSPYAVEFLDASGARLARYPLLVLEAEEGELSARRISGSVPLPAAPFASYRIVRSGETLVESGLLTGPAAGAFSVTPPAARLSGDAVELRWASPGGPVLVRYSTDGGQTWNTLAVDYSETTLSILRNDLPEGTIRFEIIPADRLDSVVRLDWEHIR